MTPASPENQLSMLQAGDHLCLIYETEEERRNILIPFIRQGLEKNEKILYIADKTPAENIVERLLIQGFQVQPYLEKGQFQILEARDYCLTNGEFRPEDKIKKLEKAYEKALAEGYAGLRIIGEMTWVLSGIPGSGRLIEYEIKLNSFLPEK